MIDAFTAPLACRCHTLGADIHMGRSRDVVSLPLGRHWPVSGMRFVQCIHTHEYVPIHYVDQWAAEVAAKRGLP